MVFASEADKAISDYDKEVKRNGEYWARLMPARRQLIVGVLLEMDKEGVELNTVWSDWKKEKKETPTVLEPTAYEDTWRSSKAPPSVERAPSDWRPEKKWSGNCWTAVSCTWSDFGPRRPEAVSVPCRALKSATPCEEHQVQTP
jgi:hypothetical protein